MIQQLESGQDVTHLFNGLKSGDDVTHLFEDDKKKDDDVTIKADTKKFETKQEPIKEPEKPKQESSFLSKAWHTLSDPLTDAPSRFANKVANYIDEPSLDSNPISPYIKGFLAGSTQGLGNLASGMTSPLNLGLTLASGGEYGAVKAGLPKVAQLMNYGVKALSAPVALHGASNVLSPDSTLEQRLMGIPEIAGGVAGLRSKVPQISDSMHGEPTNFKSQFGIREVGEGVDVINENNGNPLGHFKTPEEAQLFVNDLRNPEKPTPNIPTPVIPIQDETGKEIAPPQNFPQERPNGPWDKNIAQKVPKSGEELAYELARQKFNMGKDLPVDESLSKQKQPIQPSTNIKPQFNPKGKTGLTGSLQSGDDVTHLFSEKPTVINKGEEINTETGEIIPPKQPPPNEPPIGGPPNNESPNNNPKEPNKPSLGREMYEMSRQLMSVDLPYTTSAAFRQAAPMIGTKEWFKAWISSAQSYGSKTAYESIMQRIENEPLVKPDAKGISFIHDTMGVKLTDLKSLSSREEFTRSQLAEKIPIYGKHIAGSNRAYTAFLNDLRVNTAKNLIGDAEALGLDPKNNIPLAKQIGEFINTATGRGSLQTSVGLGRASYTVNMERNAKLLTDVFFSPRLMASRIQMLNPQTYIMAQPFVRKQYLYGMMRAIGAWWSVASLAKLAGGNVSTDANNADFGKIKIGNTRIDPGAGFQQYLVLGHRMLPGGGITSSNTGKFTEFGKGYKPNTRLNTIEQFGASKLHPELKLAYDLLNANPSKPVFLGDRAIQMAVPMVASDLMELAKQDPSIAMLIGIPLAGTAGIGVQTYDKNSFKEPTFTGKNWDMRIPNR